MTSRPPIRAARAGDVAVVAAVVRAAYAPYVARIGREPAPMAADYAALVGAGEVWIATDEADRPNAVLVMRPRDAALFVENVAVRPGLQGRGIGRALLTYAEECGRALGLAEVTLYTNELMVENLGYYPALGYVETDRRREDGFDRVFFVKRL